MRTLAINKAFSWNCFTSLKLVLLGILVRRKHFQVHSNLLSIFSKICNQHSAFCCITLTKTAWDIFCFYLPMRMTTIEYAGRVMVRLPSALMLLVSIDSHSLMPSGERRPEVTS